MAPFLPGAAGTFPGAERRPCVPPAVSTPLRSPQATQAGPRGGHVASPPAEEPELRCSPSQRLRVHACAPAHDSKQADTPADSPRDHCVRGAESHRAVTGFVGTGVVPAELSGGRFPP